MTHQMIPQQSSPFDRIKQVEHGYEYGSARDLQMLMGYTEWRKFAEAIERARLACQNSGQAPTDHFVRADKMVPLGSGSQREVADSYLIRYGCCLVATKKKSVEGNSAVALNQVPSARQFMSPLSVYPGSQRDFIHTRLPRIV